MALFEYHIHNHVDLDGVEKKLDLILKKLSLMSAETDKLNQKLTELVDTIAAEKQETANALGALEATVASLNEIIAQGATPAELQAATAKVEEAIAAVKEIIPNLPPAEPTE